MATDSDARSVHNTLTSTTADTITITENPSLVAVANRHASEALWVAAKPATAVAAANGTDYVPPGGEVVMPYPSAGLSIVGNGNQYSVHTVPS